MMAYRNRWHCRLALITTLASGASAVNRLPAQGIDYAAADRIRTFDPLLVGGRVYPVWLSDSVRFYYEMNGSGADRSTFYLVDLYRASFDGSGLTLLSPEPGNHTIQLVPRAPYFIDTYSQIATPPVTVLRDADGKVVMTAG